MYGVVMEMQVYRTILTPPRFDKHVRTHRKSVSGGNYFLVYFSIWIVAFLHKITM